MKVKKLRSPREWEKLRKDLENKKELIIFKYSPLCPASRYVEYEFKDWCKKVDENNISIVKINVITSRNLSNLIADELNIEHESPQLIWLDKQSNVKWAGSHYSIDEKELDLQL